MYTLEQLQSRTFCITLKYTGLCTRTTRSYTNVYAVRSQQAGNTDLV